MYPWPVMQHPLCPHPCLLLQQQDPQHLWHLQHCTSCTCSNITCSTETTAYREATQALTNTIQWSCPKLDQHSPCCPTPICPNQEATISAYHENIDPDYPLQMNLMMPWPGPPQTQLLKCCSIAVICNAVTGWPHAAAHNGTNSNDNVKVAHTPTFHS